MFKYITLFVLPLFIFSCSNNIVVNGHWGVTEVTQGEETRNYIGDEKTIEFLDDGTFVSGDNGEIKDGLRGNWKHNAKANELEMYGANENKDDGIYKIELFTASDLIISNEFIKVTLKRLDSPLSK